MSGPIVNGFQGKVNAQPGQGQAGDFYGVNPRAVELAGPGQLVSPAGGLTVGNFVWANPDSGVVSQSYFPNSQIGFLHRENQAVIVSFLGFATYLVQAGFPITLFTQGDFWAQFAAAVTPGQKVWANGANGAPVGGGATAPIVTNFTGVIAANVLTVSAITGLPLGVGSVLKSASVTDAPVITAQLTGPVGGAGTYSVTEGNVASEAMTAIGVATPWLVNSPAANGEQAIISTWG